MLTVLLGGARSGKSSAALRLAARAGTDVVYLATSPHIEGDDDLEGRIARHRSERPEHWTTIEEESDLAAALRAAGDATVVIDCLTVWVNNLMHHGAGEAAIREASREALAVCSSRAADTIVISNEVGLGIVPGNHLARSYRDTLGRVNQQWAAGADRAVLMVAGRALALDDLEQMLA